ncbi:hypothetical protein GCM10027346_03530 [Hymenobacter seoulensis]
MKTFTHILIGLALLFMGVSAQAATVIIKVGDNFYDPIQVTIQPGDVVTWQYEGGSATHPTASDNAAWPTFTINTATPTKSITFSAAGSFPYHCTFHGGPGVGMYGRITVATVTPVRAADLAAEAFRCYPNPAHEQVTVQLKEDLGSSPKSIQVFDVRGTLVRRMDVRAALPKQELSMDVADLPGGFYLYCLIMNNAVVARQRLVITH